jgi:hypothetical protein
MCCSQQAKNKGEAANVDSANLVKSIQKNSSTDLNCWMPSDSGEIVKYFEALQNYLDKQDTTGVLSLIAFPIVVNGDSVKSDAFISSYYSTVATYLLRKTIDSSELEYLKRYEIFVSIEENDNCYCYKIFNAFPELEFNVNFVIEKKGGSLKLTSLDLIG